MENPVHLGDGVFGYFDGIGLELRLHHPASRCVVYLERETVHCLIRFWASRTLVAPAASPSPANTIPLGDPAA